MTPIRIVDALNGHRADDAARLVFEYMAMTEGEAGRPVPRSVDELPAMLSAECRALSGTYRCPGVLLLACVGDEIAGCVGLKHLPSLDCLELKRLYVRPPQRRRGIARALMLQAHAHAARANVSRIVLDVMPGRTQVVDFYRGLGYTETEPYVDLSYPMVVMRRAVLTSDADGLSG